MNQKLNHAELLALTEQIKDWGRGLGLNGIGITDTDLTGAEASLVEWLGNGFHGEMNYMAKHGTKRCRPSELEPGTSRIISVRLDYLPESLAK
ncbi:MAG: tRNA epoxyqueuosine(34) reductase QueG, partial [Candidatus Thiodiazotropha sp. (ex Lucinoma annulata)]|nr:tRNA epoxyqueuosine(34) reductase QueG [Candidatus Thiodiazotropha sp. (ex Lucinoma annulata)]